MNAQITHVATAGNKPGVADVIRCERLTKR